MTKKREGAIGRMLRVTPSKTEETVHSGQKKKIKVTIHIPEDLKDRVWAAAYYLGRGKTPSSIVEEGIRRYITELEKAHHGGRRWKRLGSEKKVPRGRPVRPRARPGGDE